MWNGTALILKASPASRNTSPNNRPSDGAPRPNAAATPANVVVPVNPYSNEMP